MKKKLLLMPLLTLVLTGCVMYNGQGKPGTKSSSSKQSAAPAEQTSEVTPESSIDIPTPPDHTPPEDLPTGEKVTVYLVFGEYGKYNGEFVTDTVPTLYLEHVVTLSNAEVGADLPGKDKVTSSVPGSFFVAWTAYNNDGKLTEYTKVPAIDGKVLYASFIGGNGGTNGTSGQELPPETPLPTYDPSSTGTLPTEGYGFKFSDGSYMAAAKTGDNDGYTQYLISRKAFAKDQVFTLFDFGNSAGWVVNIDPYSFGGTSAMSTNWKQYLSNDGSKYTVLQDFNVESVYIKLKIDADQLYFQLAA